MLCLALRLPAPLRSRPWLIAPFDACIAVFAILDISLVLPWQVQAFNLPLVDHAVLAFDRSLGFDHVAWMGWLNSHPQALSVLTAAYESMVRQPQAIIALCLVTGRIRHLDRYLCAFIIAIFLTSAISILLPTRGIVAILEPALRATPAWPHSATDVATYDALRAGALRDLGVPEVGIISFPSFHAASAVLAAWGFWAWRVTRYPALALNATVTIATVGCGGHYIADVLAGYVLAGCSILLAVRGSNLGYVALGRLVELFRIVEQSAKRTARA
jgi:membrane-associated phospholipid phosphatase